VVIAPLVLSFRAQLANANPSSEKSIALYKCLRKKDEFEPGAKGVKSLTWGIALGKKRESNPSAKGAESFSYEIRK
jgi:hypothetical protein